ncbi:MAG: vWA domain-containing protein [Pirellulales bacterium]
MGEKRATPAEVAAPDVARRMPSPPASDSPAAMPDNPAREPRAPAKGQIQSGTLTAGSFDDQQRFDDYRQYLSDVLQKDPGEKLPRLDVAKRIVIRVQDQQGRAMADARVVVKPVDSQDEPTSEMPGVPALIDLATAGDGRVVFLPGMDGAAGRERFSVAVYPPGASKPEVLIMGAEQSDWVVQLPSAASRPLERLDLALVVDTTGSMSDELEYLKVEIDGIAQSIREMFPNVDQRYALVVYRDQGDQYVTRTFDFTNSLDEFCGTLSEQRANGGGDYPEAVHLALEQAGQLSWRKDGTARVLFLVGDAPPHDEFSRKTIQAVAALRRQTVRVFPVGGSGVAQQAEFIFRAAAFLTQGRYLFLTDHSGVGDSHTPPQVPDYEVERLDKLMLRMIAAELAGHPIAASEILAIEGGQSPYTQPQPIPSQQQSMPRPSLSASLPPSVQRLRPAPAFSLSWLAASWPGGWANRWLLLASLILGKISLDVAWGRRKGSDA